MDLPFLYIIDGFIVFSVFYACFCIKPKKYIEVDLHTPLKNENNLSYQEINIDEIDVDVEALYNDD